MRERLTDEQRNMLAAVATRPNGFFVRGEDEKRILLELSRLTLVCDPHTVGQALFTIITDAGREALTQAAP